MNTHCIEAQQYGTSIVPGEYVVVAHGDLFLMTALFPTIVQQALERGYQSVKLFDQDWQVLAEWSWRGVTTPNLVD